ncbi:MAG: hypothetical protein Q9167_007964 [Letrouitia subvulpina]
MGILFAASQTPKNVMDRFYKKDLGFRWLETEEQYFDAVKRCISGKKLFLHMYLSSQPRGVANDLLVVDIDSRTNGELALRYNKLLANPAPFYNRTPHGVHLFYINDRKIKQRRYHKVLRLGILADIFTRGWITFLGEGYELFCLYNAPTAISALTKMPPLFRETASTKPLVVLGKLNKYPVGFFDSQANIGYLQNHFGLNERCEPVDSQAKEGLEHVILYFPRLFLHLLFYPPFLRKLLADNGFDGGEEEPPGGSEEKVFGPIDDPSDSDSEAESESDSESEWRTGKNLKMPFKVSKGAIIREQQRRQLDDDQDESSSYSSEESSLDEQELSSLYRNVQETRNYIRSIKS